MYLVKDKYGNIIELTDERWKHIRDYHPELEEYLPEILSSCGKTHRKQFHSNSIWN
jgi:hypothetical protein